MDKKIPPRTRIKHKKVDPIVVKSKHQIKDVIYRFLPNSEEQVRKLLISGMEEIKNRYELLKQQDDIDEGQFGGFPPLKVNYINTEHWVDRMIKQTLGAKREGLLIVWYLNDGKHTFDPFTGDVNYGISDA